MAKHFKFVKYEPKSFGGINESMSLTIMLDRPENIVGLHGDQGTCKTSNMEFLKALLGNALPANAVNSVDNNLKGSIQLKMDDGRILDASYDKNNFRLFVTQENDGVPMRSAVNSPKDYMKNLIGPLGVSPMFLKSMDGAKQVQWLRDIAKLTPAQVAQEKEITTSYDRDFKARTEVNREVKRLKGELEHSFFFNFDKEHTTFTPNDNYEHMLARDAAGAGDMESIKERFQAATKDLANLKAGKNRKDELLAQKVKQETGIVAKQAEIDRLIKELEVLKTDLSDTETRITAADEFLSKLEGAEQREEAASKEMMGVNEHLQNKAMAEADSKKVELFTKYAEQSESLSAKLKAWQDAGKKFVQAITPEVEGIEVKIAQPMDVDFEFEAYRLLHPKSTDKEVKAHVMELQVQNQTGLFYKGMSVSQLCESELWDLCLVLWHHMGVNVIFIENLNSLGSDAVERINWFAEKGHVFYSEMERGQKNLDIKFMNKIPVNAKSKAEAVHP